MPNGVLKTRMQTLKLIIWELYNLEISLKGTLKNKVNKLIKLFFLAGLMLAEVYKLRIIIIIKYAAY